MGPSRRPSGRRRRLRGGATLLAGAFALAGLVACSGGDDRADGGLSVMGDGQVPSTSSSSTTMPPADSTTTTASPPTTEEAPPPGLGRGATGPAVASIEAKLASLHYEVG